MLGRKSWGKNFGNFQRDNPTKRVLDGRENGELATGDILQDLKEYMVYLRWQIYFLDFLHMYAHTNLSLAF